jgi:broad specificity phosphatase PhoE
MPCPGGESFIDLQQRAWSFLQDISGKGKRILAVTHAGLMRAMLVRLGLEEADTVFGKKIPFGGVVMLEKNSWRLYLPDCFRTTMSILRILLLQFPWQRCQ